MIKETLVVGPLGVNCYLVGCEDTLRAGVIDPGDDELVIWDCIRKNKLQVTHILLTHGHVDHIAAVKKIQELTGAKIYLNRFDLELVNMAGLQAQMFDLRRPDEFSIDVFLENDQILEIGNLKIKTITTPGHSPGGVCFYADNNLWSGDTLFYDSIGRTDLPGGDYDKIIESVKTKLYTLPDETRVLPGHGQESSIYRERTQNPYIRLKVVDW